MRAHDDHLTAEEIEALLAARGALVPGIEEAAALDVTALERHIEACELCARVLERQLEVHSFLEGLSEVATMESGVGCPEPEQWVRLADRELGGEEANSLLVHASECDRCGLVLSALFDSESASETDSGLGARWNARELATELVRSDEDVRTVSSRRYGFGWAAAGIAAVLVLSVAVVSTWRASSASAVMRLLNDAYAANRTLELRLPGAAYAPLRSTRGPAPGAESPELLEARARVLRALRSSPEDRDWLHARAKADLLSWEFPSAIPTLELLAGERPDAMELKVDLAIAYFERAESEERPIDFGRALELLDAVVEREPANATALFNRAVLLEKMQMPHRAVEAWDAYLELDPNGAWSREARERLEAVRQRVEAAARAQPGDDGLYRPLGERPEERLQRALTETLLVAVAGEASTAARRQLGGSPSSCETDTRTSGSGTSCAEAPSHGSPRRRRS